jgi:hypothetical protein
VQELNRDLDDASATMPAPAAAGVENETTTEGG